jgi:hypothetical protein
MRVDTDNDNVSAGLRSPLGLSSEKEILCEGNMCPLIRLGEVEEEKLLIGDTSSSLEEEEAYALRIIA